MATGAPLPDRVLASQKNHLALYLGCLYGDQSEVERFRQEWLATGRKLDMGKSCIRFKKLDGLPLDVIGEAFARISVERLVADYEKTRTPSANRAVKLRSAWVRFADQSVGMST